ncbi:MAG: ExbD/TolR family protein [Fibrobacterota bacterium]
MAMKRRKPHEPDEVDITPMIDIVFQLIIFFMVIMSIAMVFGISIKFPPPGKGKDQPKSKESKTLLVYIGNDKVDQNHNILINGDLRLNGESIPLGYKYDLSNKKERSFRNDSGFIYLEKKMEYLIKSKGYKNKVLTIKGENTTYHGKVIRVIDAGKAVRCSTFALMPPSI